MEWVLIALAGVVAVLVGSLIAYALVLAGAPARSAARPERTHDHGKTRYEIDNQLAWNPWPFVVVAVVVAGFVAILVLFG